MAAEVAAEFAGRAAMQLTREQGVDEASAAAGAGAFYAARTAGMTLQICGNLAAMAAARATVELLAGTRIDELAALAAASAYRAAEKAGLAAQQSAKAAMFAAAQAAWNHAVLDGAGSLSEALAAKAAKAAGFAWGLREDEVLWVSGMCVGRLVCEKSVEEGMLPHEVAREKATARSQIALVEVEKGQQRLEDAALEGGLAAHRIALHHEDLRAVEISAASAASMAEALASAAWKAMEEVAAWAARAALRAMSAAGVQDETLADLSAKAAGQAVSNFLLDEGRTPQVAPQAAGLAASKASDASGFFLIGPKA